MRTQVTADLAASETFAFGPLVASVDYQLGVAEISSPASFGRMPERTIQRHWLAVCGLLSQLGAELASDAVVTASSNVFTATF